MYQLQILNLLEMSIILQRRCYGRLHQLKLTVGAPQRLLLLHSMELQLLHQEVDIVLSFISHFRDSNDKLMISWYSVAVFSMGWLVESVNLPMPTYILQYDAPLSLCFSFQQFFRIQNVFVTPPLGADPPAPRCGPMPAKRIQRSMTLFHQVPTGWEWGC